MAYELTGKIKLIGETQTFASGFSKRELVITTEEDRYPQDIVFEAMKEKGEALDALKPGEQVKVFFDIRGREYNGRHFVNLSIWKVEPVGAAGADAGKPGRPKAAAPEPEDTTDYSVDLDDPF